MRVFVTGATGFVGSAVVKDLIAADHSVLGLARSDSSAKALEAAGADVQRGDVQDLDSLKRGAAAADGVIHTAFIHDFSKFEENCEIDRRAIEALGDVLAGTDKPLIITSGTGLALASGPKVTEDDRYPPDHPIPRVASEQAADAVAARGVKVMVMRLPQVHGDGDHGFVPLLINLAREKGVAAYVGDGSNRWPAVHRFDAAKVYCLALERGSAGARFHAVAEEGIALRAITEIIGRRLGMPVVSLPREKAAEHFGWFAHFASGDAPASSAKTRELLGWEPTGPGLIEDLDRPIYFKT